MIKINYIRNKAYPCWKIRANAYPDLKQKFDLRPKIARKTAEPMPIWHDFRAAIIVKSS